MTHYMASALAAIFAVADAEGVEYDAHAIIQDVGVKMAMNSVIGAEVETQSGNRFHYTQWRVAKEGEVGNRLNPDLLEAAK